MGRKDRQHYVSRSYLRTFSPELEIYLKGKDTWDNKRKKKFKDKMKIHFYDIEKGFFGYRKIYSLAQVDNYLLPTVDKIVRQLSLMKDTSLL